MEFIKQNKLLSFFLLADFLAVILSFIFQDPVIADSMEHVRASWLVSLGDVPYRDFFEHHHPLLWYTFAPIINILPHNAVLSLYVARFCAFIVSVITILILYRIIKDFGTKEMNFYYFLILFFLAYPCVYSFSSFKPDAFARLFYFWGLYSFFVYIKEQKTRQLVYCFCTFFISFLFLQIFAFDILPLIIPALIVFYKNPKFYRDVCIALLLPLTIGVLIFYFMLTNNIWTSYFEMNWLFNKEFVSLLFADRISVMWSWSVIFMVAFGIMMYQLRQSQTIYFKILCFLFVTELLQHIIFKTIYPHYLVMPLIFAALIVAPLLQQFWHTPAAGFFKVMKFLLLITEFIIIAVYNNISYMQTYRKINSSADNQIINITYYWLNIYAPKINFYTLVPQRLAIVDNYLFNRFPEYDINKLVQERKIKYIDYAQEHFRRNPLYQGRFKLSERTLRNYREIRAGLYQRRDILPKIDD